MTADMLSSHECNSDEILHPPATATAMRKTTPAFVFDVDGVLVKSKRAIENAPKALQLLEDHNIPYIILTNGGGLTEAEHAARLSERLGMVIHPDQFIQSHTPYRGLVEKYRDEPVLVLGGHSDQIRKVARSYGFRDVWTSSDMTTNIKHIHPFPEMTSAYHAQFSLPRGVKPARLPGPIPDPNAENMPWEPTKKAAFLEPIAHALGNKTPDLPTHSGDGISRSSSGYFPKLSDINENQQSNSDSSQNGPPSFPPPIKAILMWASPRDWCLDLQLTLDLLSSKDGVLGNQARAEDFTRADGSSKERPELFFCNPDLEWATAYEPSPRLAQGAFIEALKGIWSAKVRGRSGMGGNAPVGSINGNEEGGKCDDSLIDVSAGVNKITITNETGETVVTDATKKQDLLSSHTTSFFLSLTGERPSRVNNTVATDAAKKQSVMSGHTTSRFLSLTGENSNGVKNTFITDAAKKEDLLNGHTTSCFLSLTGEKNNGVKNTVKEPEAAFSDLQYEIYGKPTYTTYKYAEKALDQWWDKKKQRQQNQRVLDGSVRHDSVDGAMSDAIADTVIDKVYMIGDNPASDIAGANTFRSQRGWEWVSVLIGGTGVYRPGEGGMPPPTCLDEPVRPKIFVNDDVLAAVEKVLNERHPGVLAGNRCE